MEISVKKLSKNINFYLFMILLICCLLETGCSQHLYKYSASGSAQHYPILKYKFMELAKILPKSIPTTEKKIQLLFNNQLHIESEDEYSIFYIGGPFITKDGVVVTSVDARVKKDSNPAIKMISFDVDQRQCVSTELLKKKFGLHILFFNTPHPVMHPIISYNTHLKGISFGVRTTFDNEDCVSGLGVFVR